MTKSQCVSHCAFPTVFSQREGVSSFVVSDRTRSKSSPGSEHELITLQPSHSSLDAREQHSSFSNKEEKEDKEGKKGEVVVCVCVWGGLSARPLSEEAL